MEDKYPIIIPYEDMMKIIKHCGGDGYALYSYYNSKGQRWNWINKNIGKDLDWSESKVKRVKDSLKEIGYLYWFQNKGNKYTYIGPTATERGEKEELIEKGTSATTPTNTSNIPKSKPIKKIKKETSASDIFGGGTLVGDNND